MKNRLYYSFNNFLKDKFKCRVHKLSLNAGFTCPNLDGTKDNKGCIFCDNKAFSPYLGSSKKEFSLEEQIRTAMDYSRKRFKAKKFIAYFQSYTNTYADKKVLEKKFSIIKKFPDIVGLSISTRPDCIDKEKLDLIEGFSQDYMVWLEYGLQTADDKGLKYLNRNHTYRDFVKAVELTRDRNIFIGTHLILGIPGQTPKDMLSTAKTISTLPISGVKFHCLHVVRDTPLEPLYKDKEVSLMSESEYIKIIVQFLELIPSYWVILRLISTADRDCLIAPNWINRKQEVIKGIEDELVKKGSYQGKFYA